MNFKTKMKGKIRKFRMEQKIKKKYSVSSKKKSKTKKKSNAASSELRSGALKAKLEW